MSSWWLKTVLTPFVLILSNVQPAFRHLPFELHWNSDNQSNLTPVQSHQHQQPDVTAVVLNWARLPNVVQIAAVLCTPNLDGVIANVTIWNNNPQPIHRSDFEASACPPEKLHIYNSPKNVYFQARFLACAQASTPYCFIQDDDYLVWPEIIRTLRARIPYSAHRSIHLLPPHEALSSTLRNTNAMDRIHTGFAWLGHGTMVSRSRVRVFLQMMKALKATEEEMKMADNYFSILSNAYPEIWFDQGVDLTSGSEAFTAGVDGDERNRKHIMRATEMLDSIINPRGPYEFMPYSIDRPITDSTPPQISRAPCRDNDCLFETNMQILPSDIHHSASDIRTMLDLEAQNLKAMGTVARDHYLKYPPSNAVDRRRDTAFCVLPGVTKGDYWLLDLLHETPLDKNSQLEYLVDPLALAAFRSSMTEVSSDGIHWEHVSLKTNCDEQWPAIMAEDTWRDPVQCRAELGHLEVGSFRYFRKTVLAAVGGPLCFYDIRMKGM